MGNGHLKPEHLTARAVARTLDAEHVDVEPPELSIVDAILLDDEDDQLSWFVSLLVENNASTK